MIDYPSAIKNLIEEFKKLPTIGPKSAQRIVFFILKQDKKDIEKLAETLISAKTKLKFCKICGNISETDLCAICTDDKRDKSIICVVEEPNDLISIERTKSYNGLYHILFGAISPLDGIGPEDLKIEQLKERLKNNNIKELIIATNPNTEGETTALYLTKIISDLNSGIKVTRIAQGLPIGSDLEHADVLTLSKSIQGRS